MSTKTCDKCDGEGELNADPQLGLTLRAERKAAGVRARAVAGELGICSTALCRLEQGATPHLLTLPLAKRWRRAVAALSRKNK